MVIDSSINMKKFCEGKLTPEQEARVREVAVRLQIREDDAVWQLLEAMEYQRIFYEKLPRSIEATSDKLLKNIKESAEAQVAKSKAELTKEVVEQARTMSLKMTWSKLLPYSLCGIIALLIFGVFMVWLGYCVGIGKVFPLIRLFYMPAGALITGACLMLAGSLASIAANKKTNKENYWLQAVMALLTAIIAGAVFVLSLY